MEISSKRVVDQVSRESDLARVGSRVSQVVRVSDRTARRDVEVDDCCVQLVVAQTQVALAGCRLKLKILVDMQQILLAMAMVIREWSRCSGLRKLIRYRCVLVVANGLVLEGC